MYKYSIIIPVYNRPREIAELLESLAKQTAGDFDLIIIEDGSIQTSEAIVKAYSDQLNITYHFKENSGPGDSRNVGMAMATGDYLIFFDSDCIIPPDYFAKLNAFLTHTPLDTFGGPDSAHDSFSAIQKAINYTMTSMITTGGVRGKENKLDKYQPRSFNMGIKRKVYEKIGGFSDIHPGEDPDLSYRIMKAGYRVGLVKDAFVYHKRRIDFAKFAKQVYKFGVVRPILIKWYPENFKLTYLLPSLFLLGSLGLVLLSFFISPYFMLPLLVLAFFVFAGALLKTKSFAIALLAVASSFIQFYGYGYGFLKSVLHILILRKNEREVFKDFFFDIG